ncbi:MAG: hypothetical protein DMD85_17690 [Candidatus Rokuibacteriota bacterium]|nr:MAG: hypothetical protein DMD85_17690 [Candidatus Rokubacteria bacterium]
MRAGCCRALKDTVFPVRRFLSSTTLAETRKASAFDPTKDGELRVYTSERVSGTFERAIRLPEFVDSERISADLRHGLLTVTVPKATAAQPRKVEINSPGRTAELTA